MRIKHYRGQSYLEFAALIAVVVTAIIAMKVYMTRAFSGKYRDLSDQIGSQYDPGASNITTTDTATTVSSEYTVYNGSVTPENEVGSVTVSDTSQNVASSITVNK